MLFNEPKLLKSSDTARPPRRRRVSVLFNEPKLLKCANLRRWRRCGVGFSALQRAEIAEIDSGIVADGVTYRFSALQRAEIAEIIGG